MYQRRDRQEGVVSIYRNTICIGLKRAGKRKRERENALIYDCTYGVREIIVRERESDSKIGMNKAFLYYIFVVSFLSFFFLSLSLSVPLPASPL